MKRLLLAAAALSCLVAPAVSGAQDRGGGGDRGGGRGEARSDNRGGGGDRQSAPPNVGQIRRGVPNPNFQSGGQSAPQQAAPRPRQSGGPNGNGRGPDFAQRQGGPDRNDNRGPDNRFDNRGPNNRGPGDRGGDAGQFRRGPEPVRPGGGPPQAGRDDRFDRYGGPGRAPGRFDSYGPRWSRNDPNWWRGRPEFRGYSGPRSGFWFFPSYGYIRPDARYYGYNWGRGDLVPYTYRQYVVADPFLYGLDWPPPGMVWIYLGRDIVLMDTVTGRIVDVVYDVF